MSFEGIEVWEEIESQCNNLKLRFSEIESKIKERDLKVVNNLILRIESGIQDFKDGDEPHSGYATKLIAALTNFYAFVIKGKYEHR